MDKIPVWQFTFPNHISTIKLSEKQREKYFEFRNGNIKCGSKKLWKKCIDPLYKDSNNIKPQFLKLPYVVIGYKGSKMYDAYALFNNENEFIEYHIRPVELEVNKFSNSELKKKTKYYVTNIETGEKVVGNPTQAGKPKIHIIKGQDFYVGLNEFIRSKVVNELKSFYYKHFINISEEDKNNIKKVLTDTPLLLHLNIYDTLHSYNVSSDNPTGNRWDVGNKGLPYIKTFSDFVTQGYEGKFDKLLEDDDKLNIYGEFVEFTPVSSLEDRKLVFTFYSSEFKKEQYNKVIKDNEKRNINKL